MFVNATMVESSREAHALNNTVCLLWRYISIEVSGGFHALDGVVCIYALRSMECKVSMNVVTETALQGGDARRERVL